MSEETTMRGCAPAVWLLILIPLTLSADETAPAATRFDTDIAPLLIDHCVDCHSGPDASGGLDLTRRSSVLKGGDSGPAIAPGSAARSLLWERVHNDEMPPKKPLSAADKKRLEQWLNSGAKWGTDPIDPFRVTTAMRAGYDWWSLQPLKTGTVPRAADDDWSRSPLDVMVRARLKSKSLQPSGEADRRTLIRRLSFALTGLPPSPERVRQFVADPRSDAYERLVEELLESPQYGVRWARHWLDVARFGESQGFERDKLRDDAWPWRDWVVEVLNADMPYDEFTRRQIAGDVLHPGDPSSIIATGFLVAGPWDEVGKAQQSAAMKAVVRGDELEDLVSVVGQTFLGLTVNCARCHDHKFDPIRIDEYYRLAAALDGVQHGSRQVISAAEAERARQLDEQRRGVEQQLAQVEQVARTRLLQQRDSQQKQPPSGVPVPMARWSFDGSPNDSIGDLQAELRGGAKIVAGHLVLDGKQAHAATVPLPRGLTQKTLEAWVRLEGLDQRGGGVIGVQTLDGTYFDAIVFGEQEPRRWMSGSNFFARTQSFHGDDENDAAGRTVHVAIVYRADGTIAAFRDGRPYGRPYASSGPFPFEAGKAQIIFGLRHGSPGGNRMLNGAIAAAQLHDRALSDEEVLASFQFAAEGVTVEQLLAAMTPEERRQREQLTRALAGLRAAREAIKPQPVYVVSPQPPGVMRVQLRGNPALAGDVVAAGGIESLNRTTADFGLPPEAGDAQRRIALARWLVDHPLFARVMVNRVWHYHFGTGLVDTPSDFGFGGGRPSHPEVLDWLASEFIRSGYRLKTLHRLILTSSTWRQSSQPDPEAMRIDADNRLLWRHSPMRLEAEALRDATLSAAGLLNERLGGPGYRDFDTFVSNSQFYAMKDVDSPEFYRRSLYRTWVRSGRSRFLDAFDCPDPSTKTPARAVTVTPLQALSLMNNSFVLRMSDRLAERVRSEAGADPEAQVRLAFQRVFSRDPAPEELAAIRPFVKEHGLSQLGRVLFNSNEFLYLD